MVDLTLTSLRAAYAGGLSPTEVVDQVYQRIAEVDDPNIFLCLFDQDDLRAEAKALGAYDAAKPLWGVPFAIKDNIDAAGKVTTAACPAFAFEADEDAFVVAQLRAAGALLIGKTNLDQFATGLVGIRTPYGAPKNAVDPEIVPGGSSGGSGVSVAHGIVSFALGTDTAGSGRVPAALNNIVGLKPTLGSLSATGLVPACRTLDTISIFALTVEDAYTAFAAAAAYDEADSYSKDISTPALTQVNAPLIGVPTPDSRRFFGDDVQAQSFEATLDLLRAEGAVIREVDFTPLYDVADMLYEGAWVAERYAAIEDLMVNHPQDLHPVTRQIIGAAEKLSAADAFKGIYRLSDLIRQAEPSLAGLDMLCVPTIPTFYSVADLEVDPVGPNSRFGTYTNFVNLMDMCGIAVPTPARSDGRPGSITLLAKAGEDAKIAAYASKIEAAGDRSLGATGWARPKTKLPKAAPQEDMIEVAVCGAHMSGLPLNGDLTTRGAEFVRKDATSSDYAFYALEGGGVARPGLLRVEAGQGAQVALEIWRMPSSQFGSFIATIPQPLGIGTLNLADGAQVQGFLCEATATKGARDISELGDWRRYLEAERS
ncbi:Allophanate hydrolase [Candidatus Rhodobacter oscarellae]|uniref:Allophanate hydrolase n=1 Tax=Candidatus Rhodobacter oscarellae TaxID=1675527 RepID=A0A0J9H2Q5_9RHOB|nr:allophanate hydrolase [Candidatus Rhodobacter lobularis]KMW59958.1 Allophanate hydrolase [Candidatus Rhodobacter lobularis]